MGRVHDTRRKRFATVLTATLTAAVLAVGGCTSTTDETGAAVDDESIAVPYPDAMADICAETSERLDALPTPPEEISRPDWAGEVSSALRDEATAFDAVKADEDRRPDHRALIANTEQQAAQWASLGDALADADGSGAIGDLTSEIGALTLGRDDLVSEMGLTGCASRSVGR